MDPSCQVGIGILPLAQPSGYFTESLSSANRREGECQGNSKLEIGSGTGKGVSKGKWMEGGGSFVPPTTHEPAEHHFPFQTPA